MGKGGESRRNLYAKKYMQNATEELKHRKLGNDIGNWRNSRNGKAANIHNKVLIIKMKSLIYNNLSEINGYLGLMYKY